MTDLAAKYGAPGANPEEAIRSYISYVNGEIDAEQRTLDDLIVRRDEALCDLRSLTEPSLWDSPIPRQEGAVCCVCGESLESRCWCSGGVSPRDGRSVLANLDHPANDLLR